MSSARPFSSRWMEPKYSHTGKTLLAPACVILIISPKLTFKSRINVSASYYIPYWARKFRVGPNKHKSARAETVRQGEGTQGTMGGFKFNYCKFA